MAGASSGDENKEVDIALLQEQAGELITLTTAATNLFRRFNIIGAVVICGTALSWVAPMIAVLYSPIEVDKVNALCALSAILVITGCVLCAVLQNLNYKAYIASHKTAKVSADLVKVILETGA